MPTPVTGPIDVSLSLFSGRCTELAPADLPEGVSPDNQDVVFLPGSVQSRPGASKLFAQAFAGNPTANYGKTYRQANGLPLNLYLDSLGVLRKEDPINVPGVGIVFANIVANAYANSVTHENKEYFAFHDGTHGIDIPRQYDGTFFDRVSQDGPAAQIAAVDSATAGSISAGAHQVVCMFLTRQGYLTKPSQPFSWTAAGGKKVSLTNLPIGPPNVIARVLAFTGAGGANFFAILENANVADVPIAATIVADNTSVAATIDFNDNSLFAAEGIDIPGNNLFNLLVLAPCLGVESFADRLFWWGEFNKVQGFLNMGFEGGTAAVGGANPLGWTVATAGGNLGVSPSDFGLAWQITGDGVPANQKGMITQPAFQNYLLNPILEPSTFYTFVCWAITTSNQPGNLVAEIYSPGSGGVLATARILLGNIPSASGKFVQGDFDLATPAVIPADTIIRIYATGMVNNVGVIIDELMFVFTAQPYRENDMRVSYFLNPESYDGITGDLGPSSDSSPIRAAAIVEKVFYLLTGEKLHQTHDNGTGEPSTWDVDALGDKCGAVSPRCVAKGKKWFLWVAQEDSELSLQIFGGGDMVKVSQEVQPDFSAVNQDAMQTIWATADAGSKRIYIGVPNGAAQLTPNIILPMDYRELETANDIATYGPIHISYSGKMIASDRVRKWTVWNLPMQFGAILNRSKNKKQFCVGSGGQGFGNVYLFDPAKLTDDDYGQIVPYWTSYFFVNHDMEQALPVGVHRKLYDLVALFVTGVGTLQITPLADRLGNAVKFTTRQGASLANTIPLQAQLNNDIELPCEISCERAAFKISVLPIAQGQPGFSNGTDVQFNLQHMSVRLQAHPVSPRRGRL